MHKIAAATVWLAVAFAAVLAFQLFIAVDEAKPYGTRTAFEVTTVEGESKDAMIDAIHAAAMETGRNVFKVQPEPQDSMRGRILFAFVGNPKSFEAHGGYDYPGFSNQAYTTRVAPGHGITTEDLRGRYVTDASPRQLAALLEVLDQAGLAASDTTVGILGLLLYSAGQANLVGAAAVVAIALALAISYSATRRRKIYALKSLHGFRSASSLGAEAAGASLTFAVGVAGVLIVGAPLLAAYNGLRQVSRFAGVLATTFLVLYLVVVALVVLSVLTLPRTPVPAVLKGEQASLRNAVFAGISQVTVLAIIVATASAAMNRTKAVDETLDVSDYWTNNGELYVLRLARTSLQDDHLRVAPDLAGVITVMEGSGQLLFVGGKGAALPTDGTGDWFGPEGSRSMFVNNEYLDRETVLGTDGRRIADLPVGKNLFSLLIPNDYDGDTAQLLERYTEYFRTFSCPIGRPQRSFSCDPHGNIVHMASGQDLFTFSGTEFLPAEMQDPLFLHDPVIAVVSAESGLISPMEYLSYASLNDVLFADPVALQRALRERGISESFQGVDNAADAVTTSVALAQRELRMDVVSLILGWVVLVLSTVVMVAVYCDRRRRPMFVELIHGYSFARRHGAYLATSVVLCLVGIAVAEVLGNSLQHGRDVVASSLVVTTQVAMCLLAIRVYEAKFRANFIQRN